MDKLEQLDKQFKQTLKRLEKLEPDLSYLEELDPFTDKNSKKEHQSAK